MKNFIKIFILLIVLFGLSGCVSVMKPIAKIVHPSATAVLPSYTGPKASIALAGFESTEPEVTNEVILGLREMLSGALINSNRFLMSEAKPSDIVVAVTVTEFQPQASGGRLGVGGGGGARSGHLGGLLGSALNRAHVAINIRLVNASTSSVINATSVKAQAVDTAGSFMAGSSTEGWVLAKGLSDYANTPMEKAIRICLIEAVRYIAQAAPNRYYKY
ncbi:MAG TPA: CsgG/HfaB family protein [Candidatus Omnitrophota bacterium]|nr:CsgG/HfaB family protein [Candidatus Omnitrophota bacterium]